MIKIVSDSSALYSKSEGKKNNIEITSLSVTINNKTYKEYEEINIDEFIGLINEGHIPISSQPSIGEVIDIYNKDTNAEIINISMADGLSGTYNTACMAKNMAENPERIVVINSQTMCGPQQYLVDLAQKLVEKGLKVKEIVEEIEIIKKSSLSFLMPKDFGYLVRGGRLSPLVGKIGSAIKLVPIMTFSEDRKSLSKFSTKRTFKKAVQKIAEFLIENKVDKGYKIYITHACERDLAEIAKDIIAEYIQDVEIVVGTLGPVFTTQGGPGAVAIQSIKKHKDLK